jgi:hypothetical protein
MKAPARPDSRLRGFLLSIEKDPVRTLGGYDLDRLLSFVQGWHMALMSHGIKDDWLSTVLPHQADILRLRYGLPAMAPIKFALEKASESDEGRLEVYFEALREAEREIYGAE